MIFLIKLFSINIILIHFDIIVKIIILFDLTLDFNIEDYYGIGIYEDMIVIKVSFGIKGGEIKY